MTERPTSGPAPRWGEYAPVPDQPPAVDEPAEIVDPERTTPEPYEAPTRRERPWDRALTIGLLALGGFNVLWGIPQFVDFAGVLRSAYSTAGYGTYTSDGLASVLGAVAIVLQALLLVTAVALARRALRAGRVAFWIPLVAGILAGLVVLAVTFVAILVDPALGAFIQGQITPIPASPTP